MSPCNADFDDLSLSPTEVISLRATFNVISSRVGCIRIMWTHDTAREARNTTAEDHSSPAFLLHCRDTQLGQQKGRAAVRAPRLLEVVYGDVGDGLDAGFAERGTGVVEENCRLAESGCHSGVETVNLKW